MGTFTETLHEIFHLSTTPRRRLRRPGHVKQTQNPAKGSIAAKQKARKSFKASIRASAADESAAALLKASLRAASAQEDSSS